MKLIDVSTPTYPNKFAKVDDEDFDRINQRKWSVRPPDCGNYYAIRREGPRRASHWYKMHREVIGAKKGEIVDHIDGDTLNNQKSNLRICSASENRMNSRISNKNTTGFKGVSVDALQFRAYIRADGKIKHLGMFRKKEDAARAYNEAAIKYHGEFARLNVIPNAEGTP